MTNPGWLLAIVVAGLALGNPAAAQSPQLPPATAPAQAEPQPPAPALPPAQAPRASFGQEVVLTERTITYFSGSGMWDSAFDTIVDGFKTVYAYLDKRGIKPAGAPMTIYTATDDSSFQFQAAVPIAEVPNDPPQGDIAIGKSPAGRALKFVHHGSYDAMDTTYEAITNYLDEKQLDARDLFIEEYETDPLTTPESKLVIDVYVPVK